MRPTYVFTNARKMSCCEEFMEAAARPFGVVEYDNADALSGVYPIFASSFF